MCTIGVVFPKSRVNTLTFKQCDLSTVSHFMNYTIEKGAGDIRYTGFKRGEGKGSWAGVNNYGVSFVAADSYLAATPQNGVQQVAVKESIFEAYEEIISQYTTAEEAKDHMVEFYKKRFNSPDILLIADGKKSFFIEAHGGQVACIERQNGYFASTNHFRMLYDGVPYINNHSTYLRLARAERLLESQPDVAGINALLKDQYYGNSVFSICRLSNAAPPAYFPDDNPAVTPPEEDPYFTQASVIFSVQKDGVHCAYQLNGNPRMQKFTLVSDIFNTAQSREISGEGLAGSGKF